MFLISVDVVGLEMEKFVHSQYRQEYQFRVLTHKFTFSTLYYIRLHLKIKKKSAKKVTLMIT